MMKIQLTFVIVLFCTISFSQTIINFDNVDNWQMDGSGYGNHSYTEGDLTFAGTNVYRSGITEKNGFTTALGLKSIRMRNADNSSLVFTITSSSGVGEFFLKARRWDESPEPDYSLTYQLGEDTEWHTIQLIDNDFFDNENDWVFFKYAISSNSNSVKIRIIANSVGERIFIDDFGWTDYNAPILLEQPTFSLPSSFLPNPTHLSLSSAVNDVSIYYTIDGSVPELEPTETTFLYQEPLFIESSVTINAIAVKDGMTTSLISSATYNLPNEVNSLSELRNADLGKFYKIESEVFLAHRSGEKLVVQDHTGGICIEDQNGVIKNDYNVGDGIVDFTGILKEQDSRLVFIPNFNTEQVNSVTNVIEPELVSISELNANWGYYGSRLIQLNVDLEGAKGKELSFNHEPISMTDILGISNFFEDITLGGFVLPQHAIITCFAFNSNSGYLICPRNSLDISVSSAFKTNSKDLVNVFPNPCSDIFTVTSSKIVKRVEVRDASNIIIQEFMVNKNSYIVNTSLFLSGLYFVKVYLEDGSVQVNKLLKY